MSSDTISNSRRQDVEGCAGFLLTLFRRALESGRVVGHLAVGHTIRLQDERLQWAGSTFGLTPYGIRDAAEFAARRNAEGHDVYFKPGAVKIDSRTPVQFLRDTDISALPAFWVDADTTEQVERVMAAAEGELPPSIIVTTGTKPTPRLQAYWLIDEGVTANIDAWRAIESGLDAAFESDAAVKNPSTWMRLPGLTSHAKPGKPGRVDELVSWRPGSGTRYPIQTMHDAWAHLGKKRAIARDNIISRPERFRAAGFLPTAGRTDEQLIAMLRESRNDGSWHTLTRDVIASLIGRGYTDHVIHSFVAVHGRIDNGYGDNDVQALIDGWRRKTGTPDRNGWLSDDGAGLDQSKPGDDTPSDLFRPWAVVAEAEIEPRDFLYGRHYIRKYASVTVAPGGLGKSTLALAEAICMALGVARLGVKCEPRKVAYFNAEDPIDEIQRRVVALMKAFGLDQRELTGRLWIQSGRDEQLILTSNPDGDIVVSAFERISAFLDETRPDVLFLDPLANMSDGPETNDTFRRLGRALSQLAEMHRCSIEMIHHTRKLAGRDADAEDARGGGALIGAVRSARVLNAMTADEAAKAGLATHKHHFRVDDAKANLAARADYASWYRRFGVMLANGDEVGVIEPWQWPNAAASVGIDLSTDDSALREFLGVLRETPRPSNERSDDWAGYALADILELDIGEGISARSRHDEQNRCREAIRSLLGTWLKARTIVIRNMPDARRKARPHYVPNDVQS